MVSNEKKCPNCPQVMPCATKFCKACGAEQPKKARLMKRLQALDMKKGEWLGNLKKTHNEAAMRDEAIILLEKLHAMDYKPLLLLQKEGNGKKPKITSLTPRCELDPLATQHLSKMTAFYELVCAGWKASEDTVLTLTLTPCDEQGTSAEAGPESLVEEAGPEGLVEEAGRKVKWRRRGRKVKWRRWGWKVKWRRRGRKVKWRRWGWKVSWRRRGWKAPLW
ncbi:uncharacterized protein LOC143711878 isoform X1 [Siphateles boraxobius]|uniref:uncharacterized protein LOC143711878 isoform X1 n=1 Tax=Siphateles boraxobius TaxID=180520 RepID=UPI0040640D87